MSIKDRFTKGVNVIDLEQKAAQELEKGIISLINDFSDRQASEIDQLFIDQLIKKVSTPILNVIDSMFNQEDISQFEMHQFTGQQFLKEQFYGYAIANDLNILTTRTVKGHHNLFDKNLNHHQLNYLLFSQINKQQEGKNVSVTRYLDFSFLEHLNTIFEEVNCLIAKHLLSYCRSAENEEQDKASQFNGLLNEVLYDPDSGDIITSLRLKNGDLIFSDGDQLVDLKSKEQINLNELDIDTQAEFSQFNGESSSNISSQEHLNTYLQQKQLELEEILSDISDHHLEMIKNVARATNQSMDNLEFVKSSANKLGYSF